MQTKYICSYYAIICFKKNFAHFNIVLQENNDYNNKKKQIKNVNQREKCASSWPNLFARYISGAQQRLGIAQRHLVLARRRVGLARAEQRVTLSLLL